jgi:hypothetical protein
MNRFIPPLAALALCAVPAHAAELPEMPAFPASDADAAKIVWLRQNTSLPIGQSVVFGDDNVLVVVSDSTDPAQPSVHRVTFRQEATGLDFVSRTGGRSVSGEADVDCTTGRVRARSITLFSGTDLRGSQVAVQGEDADWRAPYAGTASALVMEDVCGSPFRAVAPPVPASQAVAAPPPPPAPPPSAAPPDVLAETGPFTAQVGAFGSREAAQAYWDEVHAAFAAELNGRALRLETINAGGQILYRAGVAGFTEAAARAFCGRLEASGRGCFVRPEE